jgi:hypothetical protein
LTAFGFGGFLGISVTLIFCKLHLQLTCKPPEDIKSSTDLYLESLPFAETILSIHFLHALHVLSSPTFLTIKYSASISF